MFDWQAELGTPAQVPVSLMARPTSTSALDMVAKKIPTQATAPKPSFAQALCDSTVIYSEPFPSPVIRGDMLLVKISKEAYVCGLEACRTNLWGRLMLNKGDTPYSSKFVFAKLQTICILSGPWSLRSLGRGFYEFTFASHEDLCKVWAAGTVSLKPGVLRLFEWSKDFNMHTQRQTHAQVWICLWELPQEYWMERTLLEIAGVVGTPLLIDQVTKNRLFGLYARILVDLDLSKYFFYEVMVEREGFVFPIAIEYERLPDFCTHCKSIGHNVNSCHWLHPRKEDKQAQKVDNG